MQIKINGFDEYKPIRNSIRPYKKMELLTELVQLSLIKSRKDSKHWANHFTPWEILLLARWIIRDWNNIDGQKSVSPRQLISLLNSIRSFTNRLDPLFTENDEDALIKFARKTAFQQFWIQESADKIDLSRSILLFFNQPYSEKIDTAFKDKFGIDRHTFFDLVFMLFSAFIVESKTHIPQSYFSHFTENVSEDIGSNFLKALALKPEDFADFNMKNPAKDYVDEINHRSPLLYKPLLQVGDKYYLWSVGFVHELARFGIYDFLKKTVPSEFTNEFGPAFELYIDSRLKSYNLTFETDCTLKAKKSPSQVDFILDSNENLLMIEAKGIEAAAHVRVNPTDKHLSNAYKGNIVKALYQANRVTQWNKSNGHKKNVYLFIVTYKELYLGNFETAWKEFIQDSMQNEFGINHLEINEQNIFFLSADALDKFLILTQGDKGRMFKIIEEIVEGNKENRNRKFTFTELLDDYFDENTHDRHMMGVFDTHFKRVLKTYFNHDFDPKNRIPG